MEMLSRAKKSVTRLKFGEIRLIGGRFGMEKCLVNGYSGVFDAMSITLTESSGVSTPYEYTSIIFRQSFD